LTRFLQEDIGGPYYEGRYGYNESFCFMWQWVDFITSPTGWRRCPPQPDHPVSHVRSTQ
jgi:hypothetical protein